MILYVFGMISPAKNIPETEILWPRLQHLEQENELLREQIRLLRAAILWQEIRTG